MRVEVTMPRMGQGMEEGVILSWLKGVGATVKRGDPLIEIESDKATVEIEAFATGRLAEITVAVGEKAPIGAILGFIEVEERASQAVAAPTPPPEQPTPEPPASNGRGDKQAAVSPVAQRLAQEHGLDLAAVKGSGPGGRIVREDVAAAVSQRTPMIALTAKPARLDVSPVARKLAGENGLDLYQLQGSAPNGRIIKRDIVAALAVQQAAPLIAPVETATASIAISPSEQRQPLSRMRRIAATRMTESKTKIPHFYLTLDVDMARAMALRESLKKRGKMVSVNDLLLKAVALTLAEYPTLNATYAGDDLILHPHVNLAIAVALGDRKHPDGLITPVVQGCEQLKLTEIAERAAALAGRARENKLKPDDLGGGTFTVSNLGMFGIRQFEAIINPPQVAILAAGALSRVPVFDEADRVVARQQLSVTLSADHRATDGAEAAGFLSTFKDMLEDGFVLAE